MPRKLSPPRDQIALLRTPLTRGERRVLDLFDERLPPEWEIYVQPHLNGLRPDFVLLHPRAGIAVFEVKDSSLGSWERSPGKNPVDKVMEYRDEIRDPYCPRLGGQADASGLAAVTGGVVMAGMSTADANELLGSTRAERGGSGKAERYLPICGADAPQRVDLDVIFPDWQRTSSLAMKPELADDLRSWLEEPSVAAEQREPLELDRRVRELVEARDGPRYRRVKGPPGSGKSVLIAARARRLAAEGKRVFVLTYNITLPNYLRDLAVRYPVPVQRRQIDEGITWLHFHGWCKRACNSAGRAHDYRRLWSSQRRGRVLDDHLPGLAAEASSSLPERDLYDAILVDEGQDFSLEWWDTLRRALRPDGEMLLVADQAQDLYGRTTGWTNERMTGAGFSGPWMRLEGGHRLPATLVTRLQEFARRFLDLHEDDGPKRPLRPIQGQLDPAKLKWVQCEEAASAEELVRETRQMPAMTGPRLLSYPDVTLLVTTNELGLKCVNMLERSNVRVEHTFSSDSGVARALKRSFYKGDARVKATTVHSFKGWEATVLVIHIARSRTPEDRAAIYTALSRLKRHEKGSFLTVVCSDPQLASYGASWSDFVRR